MHAKLSIVFVLAVCYLFSSSLPGQPRDGESSAAADCSYDRDALLALDQRAFDQDMKGGWRAVARREECIGVAADLIRDYREARGQDSPLLYWLYWHEGQLRATLGETEEAIGLFQQSRDPKDTPYAHAWNLYVDATIAFLQQDEPALLDARESLAQLPRPPDYFQQGGPLSWPMNLSVVDMLVACFGQPYEEAYGRREK